MMMESAGEPLLLFQNSSLAAHLRDWDLSKMETEKFGSVVRPIWSRLWYTIPSSYCCDPDCFPGLGNPCLLSPLNQRKRKYERFFSNAYIIYSVKTSATSNWQT